VIASHLLPSVLLKVPSIAVLHDQVGVGSIMTDIKQLKDIEVFIPYLVLLFDPLEMSQGLDFSLIVLVEVAIILQFLDHH